MLTLRDTLLHYKRPDVQKAMVLSAKNRELGVMFNQKFGRRPDTLNYPADVLEFVKKGATSFHLSEELWEDPLQIKTDMPKKEMSELRIGWDLVLDVDFEVWEITKIITDLLVKALKQHKISSISCKFSGNKGFHLGVPFEAFPEKVIVEGVMKETKDLFPESVQRIAEYLMDYIDSKYTNFELSKKIVKSPEFIDYLKEKKKTLEEVSIEVCGNKKCSKYGAVIPRKKATEETEFICSICNNNIKTKEKIRFMKCPKCEKNGINNIMKKIKTSSNKQICPACEKDKFINKVDLKIDTILISSRHLFRGPYSMHEKSKLVSIPINPDKILEFKKIFAEPKNIILNKYFFLNRDNVKKGEGKNLITQAFDSRPEIEEERIVKEVNYEDIKDAIPEQLFPPCIQEGFKGIKDGRKRFLFTLINFLTSVGWNYDQVEDYMHRWNKNNELPIREVLIKGQIRYHKQQKKKVLPPNCDNKMYFMDIGICKPDALCKNIKNPVSYARIKAKSISENKKKPKKKKPSKTPINKDNPPPKNKKE
ncbi:MAG: hypothetical protein KAQ83_03065 [Nanoarchaeota archaeon]|nr:hypothetical protein [Nanoarchaeota archaeon]